MKFVLLKYLMNLKIWGAALLLQISGLNDLIVKYLISDTGFLKWLIIAMICDLATGLVKAYKNRVAITSGGFRDTVSKVIQYGSFLIITHVLTHYQINGLPQNTNFVWLNKIAYEFLILIEIKSVYENLVGANKNLDFFKKIREMLAKLMDNSSNNKEK